MEGAGRARALRRALWGLLGALLACLALRCSLEPSPPPGEPGGRAEALADRMLAAVNAAAWEKTGAVRFTFRGRRRYLWDRDRSLAEVRDGDLRVLLRLSDRSGLVFENGRPVTGERAETKREEAYAHFVADRFWLNPIATIRDEGARRAYVDLDGELEGLLVTYPNHGSTAGDSYLWEVGPSGAPRRWRMYVAVLPVRGLASTWDGWTTLATGARISTLHAAGPLRSRMITDLEGGTALADLGLGRDPFAELFR